MKHSLPFVSALQAYLADAVYPLHTPGHKGGRGSLPEFKELLQKGPAIDVSLMAELDDLHHPGSCLKEAQGLAAELYGADASFFAVNGTTGALQAMILGSVKAGEKIILPRNAHRSIVGALVISGAVPVYVYPDFDCEFSLTGQVSKDSIEKILRTQQDIKAVLVTSPTYFGLAAELKEIAQLIHKRSGLLLVDEAHGPHLGFSPDLPPAALSCGADASAQSTHKILGALTQASILHLKKTRVDIEQVRQAMSLLTTTSPNQLLLASLDAAMYQLAAFGQQMVASALELADYLRELLETIPGLRLYTPANWHSFDRTKVTINVESSGFTGYEVAAHLRTKKIAVELADKANILFLVTYADEKAALTEVALALKELLFSPKTTTKIILPELPVVEQAMTPRKAFFQAKQRKLLQNALGLIAGEEINFYPPGIPVILPGERINQAVLDYCKLHVQDLAEFENKMISVVQ